MRKRWFYALGSMFGAMLLMVLVASAETLLERIEQYGRYRWAPTGPELEIELEHRLSMDFVTPHTDWGQPYTQGQVRVLFFCAAGQFMTLPRDIIELMERFDVSAEAAYYAVREDPNEMWIGGKAGEARIMRLLDTAPDVYVFHGVSPGKLPEEARAKLMKAVEGGAGLVLIGVDDGGLLKTGRSPEILPDFLAGVAGNTYRIAQGRAIRMPGRPWLAYSASWAVDYDYWQEGLGRAVLWAAGKAPRMSLQASVQRTSLAWAELPAEAVTVRWKNSPTEGMSVEARVRRWDGAVFPLGIRAISEAEGSAAFALPHLAAGDYHLEVWARSERGTETWTAEAFKVTAARSVQVVLSGDWGEVGGAIAGKVRLTGAPALDETVWVELLDRWGRVLARRELRNSTAAVGRFRFPVAEWMPNLVRVEAVVSSGGEEMASAYRFFTATHRRHEGFNFVMWGHAVDMDDPAYSTRSPRSDTLAPYLTESLAKYGVTAESLTCNPGLEVAAYDMGWAPTVIGSIHTELDGQGIMAGGCWNDLSVQEKMINELVEKFARSRQHGAFVYNLGDEGEPWGSCLHPACMAAYRRYLEEVYGTVAALNASWGTAFRSFSEVELMTPDSANFPRYLERRYNTIEEFNTANKTSYGSFAEVPVPKLGDEQWGSLPSAINDEEFAAASGQYARHYDRRAFQAYNFVQYVKRITEAFRKVDPQARVGFEGTSSMDAAFDIDLLVRNLGFWVPYSGVADDAIRTMAPRKFSRSNWIGYSKNPPEERSRFWRLVCNGADSMWWYMSDILGNWEGFLAPDYAPMPHSEAVIGDMQVIRDGLGELLLGSQMQQDGVAILHSMPSTVARTLGSGPSYVLPSSRLNDYFPWFQVVRDLGLQFDFVTEGMLRRGEFDARGYRLLILPRTEALGPEEGRVIREFVERGGTVIADVRPGIYDGHCKPLPVGALDELFGVVRDGDKEAMGQPIRIDGSFEGKKLALSWDAKASDRAFESFDNGAYPPIYHGPQVDPAVSLAGGTALGESDGTPVCIVNRVGEGRAILLNFSMLGCFPSRYFGASLNSVWNMENQAETPREWSDLFEMIFAGAGVAPEIRVLQDDRRRMQNLEVLRWRNGDTEILGLYQAVGEKEETAHVVLPRERYVYDLRNRRPLGRVKEFTSEFPAGPGLANFYVLLPKEAPPIRVEMGKAAVSAGQLAQVRLSVRDAAGKHALRLRLLGPGGAALEWFRQPVVLVGEETVRITVPVAFNDPPGVYTVAVADLLGTAAHVQFELLPPASPVTPTKG